MTLTEKDYRKYILAEYTFLKRQVMLLPGSSPRQADKIFIGNAPKVTAGMVAAAKALKG